jgi:ferredoxin
MKSRLIVDPIKCDGRGLCAELFPERVSLDDWGFPIIAADGEFGASLLEHAERARDACPLKALTIKPV